MHGYRPRPVQKDACPFRSNKAWQKKDCHAILSSAGIEEPAGPFTSPRGIAFLVLQIGEDGNVWPSIHHWITSTATAERLRNP